MVKKEIIKSTTPKKKKGFQVFIWNSKIHNAFIVLLVVCVFLLFGAMKVQTLYIHQLKTDIMSDRSEAFDYEYDVMLAEDFLEKTELDSLSIAGMVKYYTDNNYEDIYYNAGYVEATLDQCGDKGCFRVTYRYNQNKGLYIDVLQKRIK